MDCVYSRVLRLSNHCPDATCGLSLGHGKRRKTFHEWSIWVGIRIVCCFTSKWWWCNFWVTFLRSLWKCPRTPKPWNMKVKWGLWVAMVVDVPGFFWTRRNKQNRWNMTNSLRSSLPQTWYNSVVPQQMLMNTSSNNKRKMGVNITRNTFRHLFRFTHRKSKGQSISYQPWMVIPLIVNPIYIYIWSGYFLGISYPLLMGQGGAKHLGYHPNRSSHIPWWWLGCPITF